MTTRPRRSSQTGVDPVNILTEIASDRSASSTARVAACRALLALRNAEEADDVVDTLTKRAIEMGRRHG
jgi:hypothetical protein